MSIWSTVHFFRFVFWPDMWLFLSKGVRISGTDEYIPWHLAIIPLFIGDLSYLHGIGLNLEDLRLTLVLPQLLLRRSPRGSGPQTLFSVQQSQTEKGC